MYQIKYKNITKVYDEEEKVLDNVSFSVDKGEFVFIVGPSGAGKSTLVKLLIREEVPTEGKIYVCGLGIGSEDEENEQTEVNIVELERSMLPELRRKIGVVFQDFRVLKSKNVFENVGVALDVVDRHEDVKDVVPSVLGLVGLANKAEKFPSQLSGGEIQRLSIARALAHEPDVLVADEPTGMIDPDSTREVLKVLEKINSLGTTVIIATHDYVTVDSMKRRVIRIEDGKIVSDKSGGKYNNE